MATTLKLNLHPGQQTVYHDPHRFKVIGAGRQWGKSKFCQRAAAGEALTKDKSVGMVVAPTATQAFNDYEAILEFLQEEEIRLDRKFVVKVSARWLTIYLKNGSKILMRSGEPTAIAALRGYTLDWVIIDEAAYCDEQVWHVIEPELIVKNGKGWIVSSPNGKGWFYGLYCREQKDDEFKSFHFESIQSPYFSEKDLKRAKENNPEFVFRQEYLAEFIEGGTVFPHLAEVMTSEPRDPQEKHTYTIGADIASTNDFTVIKVFDDADNHEVSHERLTNKDWGYIKQAIYTTCKYWNNATLIIDKTGVGAPVVEDLERMDRAYPDAQKLGYLTMVPIIFSSVSKPQLYTNYIMMHENRTIHLLDEPVTRQEHEDFTAKRSQENSGYMKYSAPKGRNDDTVTASALAAWGLSQNMGSAVIGTMETLGTVTDNPAEVKYEQQEPVSAWSDDDWNPSGGVGVAQGHNKVVLKGL